MPFISKDEFERVAKLVPKADYIKRAKEFSKWIEWFIELSKSNGDFPENARIFEGMSALSIGAWLNHSGFTCKGKIIFFALQRCANKHSRPLPRRMTHAPHATTNIIRPLAVRLASCPSNACKHG